MKFKILEDGVEKDGTFVGGRFSIQVESSYTSAPPSFSELPRTGNSKVCYREFGRASLEEIQEILASWVRENARPYIKAADLVKGAVVETKGEVKIRVKSPKK